MLPQGHYCNNLPQLPREANIAEETNALTKMEKTDNLELIKVKNFYSSNDAIKIVHWLREKFIIYNTYIQ